MHIGVLSTQLGTPGGPAMADRRLLHHIAKIDQTNQYSIYVLTDPARRALSIENHNFRIKPIKPRGKLLGLTVGVPMEIKKNPVDLLHATFVPPPYVPSRFVMAMTCWSQYSEPEVYPRLVRWRLVSLLNHGMRRASAVFCYTDFLKQRIIEKFDYDEERIFVLPPGIGKEMQRITDEGVLDAHLKELGIERPYILFIGAITVRKNVIRLLEAYHKLINETDIPHKLVLVGEPLFKSSDGIFERIEQLGIKDRLVLVGQQPHEELQWLYSGADVYAFPTLSEGFGITPLEAMACGTPVVASNVTSVPEVVADAAVMIDPTSTDELADALYRCLSDENLRADLIQKGLRNAAKYDWDVTAHRMVKAYEKILDEGW